MGKGNLRDVALHSGDHPLEREGDALRQYFLRDMPPGTEELLRIERVENKKIWQKYKLHRVQVQEEFQNNSCDAADVELWLWHGSS